MILRAAARVALIVAFILFGRPPRAISRLISGQSRAVPKLCKTLTNMSGTKCDLGRGLRSPRARSRSRHIVCTKNHRKRCRRRATVLGLHYFTLLYCHDFFFTHLFNRGGLHVCRHITERRGTGLVAHMTVAHNKAWGGPFPHPPARRLHFQKLSDLRPRAPRSS